VFTNPFEIKFPPIPIPEPRFPEPKFPPIPLPEPQLPPPPPPPAPRDPIGLW